MFVDWLERESCLQTQPIRKRERFAVTQAGGKIYLARPTALVSPARAALHERCSISHVHTGCQVCPSYKLNPNHITENTRI